MLPSAYEMVEIGAEASDSYKKCYHGKTSFATQAGDKTVQMEDLRRSDSGPDERHERKAYRYE